MPVPVVVDDSVERVDDSVDDEEDSGPDWRMTSDDDDVVSMRSSRWWVEEKKEEAEEAVEVAQTQTDMEEADKKDMQDGKAPNNLLLAEPPNVVDREFWLGKFEFHWVPYSTKKEFVRAWRDTVIWGFGNTNLGIDDEGLVLTNDKFESCKQDNNKYNKKHLINFWNLKYKKKQ